MAKETEPQQVEAEVIEAEATTLEVTYTEATIASNMDALEAHVKKVVAEYDGATYDLTSAQAVKDAKHDRSYLNGIKKEIEERRKAVKREYNKPLEAFERRCKQITAIIDESTDAIKAQLDEAEQTRKDALYSRLQQHYEEFAELLAPVVPYERLHEAQWLNKTFGEIKAQQALEAKVSDVARDWETLKAQQEAMPHYADAEREFFRTLDLGAALNAARLADEEDQRIAELKAAMAPEPEPEPMPEPEPIAEPEPMPAPALMTAPMTAPMPAPVPAPVAEPLEAWTVEVPSATRSQMQALASLLKAQGITGSIRRGTPAQVAARMEQTMAEDKHMTLAEAVAQVQRSVVVPKARYNAHGNFYYRSMEDIVAALKEPCKAAGIAFTLNDSIEQIGERYYVKATCRLFFEDGHGEPLEIDAYAREPLSQKGMNEAQVTGSASSYARKYALCGAFDIDGTSDPDTLMGTEKPAEKEPPEFGQFIAKCKSCGTSYQFESRQQYEQFKANPGCCPSPAWQVV